MPNSLTQLMPYHTDAPVFTHPPFGWIMHVQVGNNNPFVWMSQLKSPNRRFSHAWISKAGDTRWFQTLDRTAWAMGAGNADYYSVEFEGYPNELLTLPQINAGAVLHNRLHTVDAIVNTPGYRGVGTHEMGGAAWGGHACPGTLRARQRSAIIVSAQHMRGIPSTPPYPGGPLTVGSVGPDVSTVQRRLIAHGVPVVIDGRYGPATRAAVTTFQRRTHLTRDGVVGPITWRALWR